MKKILSLLLILMCLLSVVSESQYLDVKSLKGLDSLSVWIESPNPDSAGIGMTDSLIKADVEQSLRKAGFKVADGARQDLYLNVNVLKSPNPDLLACNIKLEILQGAWLERTEEWSYCSTWFRESLGFYDGEDISAEIKSTIADLLGMFIKDALSVNPELLKK